jgi:hypothetical protein
MKKVALILSTLITACTFLPSAPPVDKITAAPVEHPFFNIPPMNLEDYQSRTWILLAESSSRAWFYDPYSLTQDKDDIVSYDAFFVPRSDKDNLQQFNATMVGPYRQKIDCFSNHQWSETFYADKMPNQETYKNPQKPNLEYGWIKIKPSTALAYVRARICGRKFIDDKSMNYFLYQEGTMKYIPPKSADLTDASGKSPTKAAEPKEDFIVVPDNTTVNVPIFYDVIDNEIRVVDSKKDIRSMRISSYFLNKNLTKKSDYLFTVNCQAKSFSFVPLGKPLQYQELEASRQSLTSVAFDRACGNHGDYMNIVAPGKNK